MNIEKAVTLVEARMRKTGNVASAVVRDLWSRISFDRGTVDLLAQEGLRYRVNNDVHYGRDHDPNAVQVSVTRKSNDTDGPTDILVSVMYAGAEGEMVALVDFTKEDFQAVSIRSRAQATGYMQIAQFMESGIEVLTRHKAKRVRDLPKNVQADFAGKWPRM